MSLSLGLLLGLVALVATGLNSAWGKIPAEKLGSIQAIVFRNLVLVALLLALNIVAGTLVFLPLQTLLAVLGISLVGYLALFFLYSGFRIGKVGVLLPIANSSLVLTVLFAAVFLNEIITIFRFFSIALILFGVILISVNFKDLKNSSLLNNRQGVWFALLTCLLWGIFFFAVKFPVQEIGPFMTSLLVEGCILLFALVQLFLSGEKTKRLDRESGKFVLLVAVFSFIGSISYNVGIQVADVSLVSALIFSSPLVGALYAKWFYKEKLARQQYFAIFLLVLGLFSLAFFQ